MAALAHHKALVTTRPAVPVALFKNGENMFWPATNDAEAFAGAIFRVLGDGELRQGLEAGAAALARHFEWPEIAKNTRAFFRNIIEKKMIH